jgi:predicted DNA-binding transcriptional regulator AlpA
LSKGVLSHRNARSFGAREPVHQSRETEHSSRCGREVEFDMIDSLVRARDIYAGDVDRVPLISIGETKFFDLVKRGAFPPPDCRIGGAVLWRLSTVQGWIAAQCADAAKEST